ncbi:MAG: nicotinate-nucleotide adenylyltransferase [Bacillota bacterium]|jgi:nicotinate-nucleotide adenylyltransferase|nr:nicotinate-nucleotide adenylyltransferase [Eubacteriales bacterium]MDI9492405.1 nicotinate-nucleotide adenylyltransferase [Bacillota bacterium]NLV70208.1 nicotinate (nicotinamide) nucleotide adenylyltransferase [Clostridiales bacterium]MDD3537551.1 nicotinate-nucleotide adenylyltransferase [Eubacteriales bacterium]MDD4285706.1 nicotinate-nucleotide adenylyltransferase [Eubacteriales bacterium]
MKQRIGVLGGSFDPIHYGHLILAEQIKTEAKLDRILFVPAFVSPFKIWNKPVDRIHRLKMLELAIGDHDGFDISTIELDKDEPSYTYETLCSLRQQYGSDTDLYFIIGTDAFMHIEEWNCSRELLSEFSFLIGLRKGYNEGKLETILDDLATRYPLDAQYIRIPELEIAASDLRDRMATGKSVKFLLPDPVIDYIQRKGLYQSTARRLQAFVRDKVDEDRFRHTQGVVSKALELAHRFGADPEKAEIAAWFHDAYREMGNLEHGPAAAVALQEQFGIDDPDILDAVRYHTTGRKGMCLLEKIIYLADSIEDGRDYPGVEELRSMDCNDIDTCIYHLMVHTREYVEGLGLQFHPRSIEAIEELKRCKQKEKIHE